MPILERGQEEAGVDDDSPDGNVCKNAADQVVAVNHHGTVPHHEEEGESQRHGNNGGVDPAGEGRVAEVQGCELQELNHLYHFGKDEVRAAPQHDPGKVKEVEKDKVRANRGCSLNVGLISREKMPDVADLEDPKDNPVDGYEDVRFGERSYVEIRNALNTTR